MHKAGFTGGAWSKESAIKMIEMSIAEKNYQSNKDSGTPIETKKFHDVFIPDN